ncbi:MAG: tRNA 2-thiouridine(34) synthase MnmA [Sphingobacteriales bacterium]|nr:MAG: tRNA 2-thiouridine(34) synthase MnmA [Sphingobacteriales bacterium]
MSRNGRVLVAMSGGIDSTVAAVMLKEQGYEVIGITMKTWDYENSGGSKKETGCCSMDSINDARTIAVQHGIHHFILDIRDEFGDFVIDNFVDEYMAGRTPNPCVLCNTHIKWQALLKRADKLDCEFIATGHYAKSRFENERYIVSKGLDNTKDQSYVLWGLSQESLARTMLPLGKYRKSEIREIALSWGYDELVKKSESFEICFIPDNDYRSFLKRKVDGLEEMVEGGEFMMTDGTVVGKHRGYPFYTVGQRKGLDIALGKPVFVVEIDPAKNRVILGEQQHLQRRGMLVKNLNLQKYASINGEMEALTKVRYKDAGALSLISQPDENTIKTEFYHGVNAIAPGQSAVWYEGDDVIGGGNIYKSYDVEE